MKDIDEIVSKISSLDQDGNIDFIFLYGSVSEGISREGSDIDVCIKYNGDEEERNDFRFKVLSYFMNDDLDVHIYDDLPLYIRKDIFKGKLLFSRDRTELSDLAYREIKEFEDFAPRYHDYIGMGGLE